MRVIIDNLEYDLSSEINLEKNKKHNILIVIDRLIIKDGIRSRLYESIELACKEANGKVVIDVIGGDKIVMSEKYACPDCDFSLPVLEPRLFSFNAPYGACPECNGLGIKMKVSEDLIMPNKDLSINEGAIKVLSGESNIMNT
jgi:excinuclease ABC subunit A